MPSVIFSQNKFNRPSITVTLLLKGTRCLGMGNLGYKKRLKVFDIRLLGWKHVLKVEYDGPHKFSSKLTRGFPFTL